MRSFSPAETKGPLASRPPGERPVEAQGPSLAGRCLGHFPACPVAEVLDCAEGESHRQDEVEGDGDRAVHEDAQVPFGDGQCAAEFGLRHRAEDHGDQHGCQRDVVAAHQEADEPDSYEQPQVQNCGAHCVYAEH